MGENGHHLIHIHRETFFREVIADQVFWLKLLCIVAAIVLPGFALYREYIYDDWANRIDQIRYFLPMTIITPLWIYCRLNEVRHITFTQILLDLSALLIAMSRMVVAFIPFSGHMVFLAYTFMSTKSNWYRVFAMMLLLDTTYFKWIVWGSFLNWGFGLAIAITLAKLRKRRNAES